MLFQKYPSLLIAGPLNPHHNLQLQHTVESTTAPPESSSGRQSDSVTTYTSNQSIQSVNVATCTCGIYTKEEEASLYDPQPSNKHDKAA